MHCPLAAIGHLGSEHLHRGTQDSGGGVLVIARRAYCVESSKFSMCVRPSVRPPPPPTVRPSVTLIGSAPDLVTRNWVLPLHRPSSRPKTGPKLDDLVIGHDSSDLVTRIPYYHLISYFVRHSITLKFCTALHYGPKGRPLPCRSYLVIELLFLFTGWV